MSVESAAKRLAFTPERLAALERGDERPTVPQLRSIARVYKRPLATFFLPSAPTLPTPIHDFRRVAEDAAPAEESTPFLFELRSARRRRAIAQELLTELDQSPVEFTISARIDERFDLAAARARKWIGVALGVQESWHAQYDALNGWLAAFEKRGVLVFQTGSVPLSVMRGFSIADRVLPVIALNGKDSPRARVFTLMHEFAHLMLSEGGVCDPLTISRGPATHNVRIESFCNAVAGSILVPENAFNTLPMVADRRLGQEWPEEDIRQLADLFAVSREVIVLRLRSARKVDDGFVTARLAQYRREYRDREAEKAARPKDKARKFGIPRYRIALRNNGRSYTRLVFDALERDRITLADASDYLDLRIKHFEQLEEAAHDTSQAVE